MIQTQNKHVYIINTQLGWNRNRRLLINSNTDYSRLLWSWGVMVQ